MAINNFNAKNGLSVGSNPINVVDNTANATFATAMTTGSMGVGTPVVATSRLFVSGTSTGTDTTLAVRAGVPSPSGRLLDIRNNTGISVASVDYLGNIFGASGSFGGDVTITGNLTVAGTQTIVNSEIVNIKDNIVLLNANPSPAATGGIYVADTVANTTGSLIWDSTTDVWKAGKVGSEVALVSGSGTNNYVVKWSGSNALNTSVIYDDGTNVGIGTSLLDSKLVVAGNIVVSGSVNPSADNNSNYVIGTAAKRWSNVVSNAFSGSLTKLSDGVTNYLQAGANIVITTGSNGSVSVTTTGLAPSSAQYLTLMADSSLTSERVFAPGNGLQAADGGAGNNYTLSINNGIVATVSGTTFTGVTNHNVGLSGSLTRLTNGTSYLVAGNNMQITTGSSGAVTIASTATGATYVAGSNTQVQFNDGGTFGADGDFTFDKTSNLLKVTNISGSLTSSNVSTGQVTIAGTGGVLSGSNDLFWVNSSANLVVGAGTTAADPTNRLQLSDNQTNLRGMEFRPGAINYIISYNRGTPAYLPFHLGASTFKFSDGSYTNFIDSVGNVGIGMSGAVTSVSSKLLVSGSATASTPTTTIREGVTSPTGGVGVLDVQNSTGTSILFVSGSGRVGVGTNVLSTSNKFEVHQGRLALSGYSSELYLEGSNSGYSTITSFGAGNYKDLWLRTVSGTTDGIWIKSLTGNVGIGTSLLDSRFVVNGNVVVSGSVNPDIDTTRDLGTSAKRWRNLYATNISGSLTGSNVSEGQIIVAGAGGVLSGSNNFWWDNVNNNVGIGTSGGFNSISATESTLHISNSNLSSIYLSSTATGRKWSILSAAGGTFSVRDNTGSAYRIVVNSAGNVGIGSTLTVSAQLQVSGSSVASTPTMVIREGVVSPTGGVGVLDVQNSVATSLLFVSGSGRVGIGVTIPNASLDILSSVPGASEIRSSGNNVYQVFRRSTNTTVGYIGSGASLVSSGGSNSDFGIAAPAAGANLILVTGATERLRVDSSGNVGIGTVDANGNRLAISGGNLSVTGSVLPGVTTTYDLGSTTYRWRDIYARSGSFSGDVTVSGDLFVNGTQFIVNTQVIEIEDNAILLNAGPSPAATGGIYVADTTTNITGSLLWDATTDQWKAGKLGSEVALVSGSGTNNYVTKWNGSNALGTSVIFDNGTNVGVGTSTINEKLVVQGNLGLVGELRLRQAGTSYVTVTNTTDTLQLGGQETTGASNARIRLKSNFIELNATNTGIGTTTTTDMLAVNGNMSVTGSLLPGSDDSYVLGNSSKRWSNIVSNAFSGSLTKLSDGTTNYLQAGPNITLTTGSNGAITIEAAMAAGTISGGGTANYIAKFTGTNSVGNSIIYDNGTNVGIGTTVTSDKLAVNGSVSVTGSLLPGVDNLYDLGSIPKRWRSIQAVSISGSLTGSNILANQVVIGGTGGVLSGTNYFTYDGNLNISGSLRSLFSAGDEGGELFFSKPQTNSTLTTGVTIDLWRNRIRIFETEGTNRGGYFDISALSAGVGTNLTPLPGGSDTQVQFNDGGAFGGSSGLTYSKTTGALTGTYVVAATGFSGSLTRLTNGTSYIIAGGNMSVVSGANGAITLATVNSGTIHGVTAGNGLLGGGTSATVTLAIDNGIIATVSGTTFTGVTNHNAGLSGSLTRLTNGTSYLIAGNNVQITTGSTGAVTIASTATGATYIAGSNTQVQFNDGGTFGADADFIFDKTNNLLKVTNISGSLTGSNVLANQIVYAGPGGVLTGSNNLWWDNANTRVGIGTNSPAYCLDVQDTATQVWTRLLNRSTSVNSIATQIIAGNNGSTQFQIDVDGLGSVFGTGARMGTGTNHFLSIMTSGTERVRFDTSGNVGIGTSSFSARLHVSGSSTSSNPTLTLRPGVALPTGGILDVQTSTGVSVLDVYETSIDSTIPYRGANGTATSPTFSFTGGTTTGMYRRTSGQLLNFTVSGVQAFGIDTNGNAAVGVTATSQSSGRLHVQGGSSAGDATTPTLLVRHGAANGANLPVLDVQNSTSTSLMFVSGSGNVGIGTTTPLVRAHLYSINVSGRGQLMIDSPVNDLSQITFYSAGTTQLARMYSTTSITVVGSVAAAPLTLETSAVERMRIDTSGNVGIGTATFNDKLAVNGSMSVTGSLLPGVDDTYNLGSPTKRWANVYADNITASGSLAPAYTTPSSTSGGTAIFDTVSTSAYGAVYELMVMGNPNLGGSGLYMDVVYGKVIIGTGWNGSTTTSYIQFINESPDPRSLYPSGGGPLTVDVVYFQSSAERIDVAAGSAATIRVKVSGYVNNTGYNTTVRLKQLA